MRNFALDHLSDRDLLRDLRVVVARERTATAEVLAHIAEVDERRLYLPAGLPSMRAYCVEELHYSEDAAYKRIQAARVAREFPAIFTALDEGRLHLTGVGTARPPPQARECRGGPGGGHRQDQGRDRADAGAALPTNGAAGAGPAHPADIADRAGCLGTTRG